MIEKKAIVVSASTERQIEVYKKSDCSSAASLILYGKKGSGKFSMGYRLARFLLDYNGELDISEHPDFYILQPDGGQIRKEQVDQVIAISTIRAAVAPRKVFLIDDADLMNEYAANAILKVLEDGNLFSVFIFIAHTHLLNTIESRCITISFSALTKREYATFLQEEINETAWLASDGRPGLYQRFLCSKEYLERLEHFSETLFSETLGKDVLIAAGAMKEKDKNYLHEVFSKEQLEGFINFCWNLFYQQVLETAETKKNKYFTMSSSLRICNYLSMAKEKMEKKGLFTRNDFFDLLCKILREKEVE